MLQSECDVCMERELRLRQRKPEFEDSKRKCQRPFVVAPRGDRKLSQSLFL